MGIDSSDDYLCAFSFVVLKNSTILVWHDAA